MTLQIKCENPTPRGQGIKYIEINKDDRTKLTVHFLEPVKDDNELINPKSYDITGGSRIQVKVNKVVKSSDSVVLHLDKEGDFSIYTLEIKNIKTSDDKPIDPFFKAKKFSFKLYCDSEFDCRKTEEAEALTAVSDTQTIDYMAKDFDSFRRALIDLIPSKIPAWIDISEADFGIAMLEMFAHVADQLSYYQDRVANESYLKTATQRFSVKNHADLIDYKMHNGAAATTYIYFFAKKEKRDLIPKGFRIEGGGVVFELDEDTVVDDKLHEMTFYTWDNRDCYLPKGSTHAVLKKDYTNLLAKDDLILIKDAQKNKEHYINPWRREVVRLTENPKKQYIKEPPDPSNALTEITWSEPLKYEYCLDNDATIACGNIAKASHGERIANEELKEQDLDEIGGRLTFTLKHAPLTYVARNDDLSEAEPEIEVKVNGTVWKTPEIEVEVDGKLVKKRGDMLDSGRFDQHYTVTTDNEGYGIVSFGNGQFGQRPPQGSIIEVSYRVGCGAAGNVGRDTLTIIREKNESIDYVTNPVPATGGRDPESIEEVKMNAPKSIKKDLFKYRAITPEDYEMAAKSYTENGMRKIARAKARFIWTGSWYTVFVSVDPVGTEKLPDELKNNLEKFLNERKLAGYDLKVMSAVYVPVEIKLKICVKPIFFVRDVKEALNQALSNKALANGKKGFFHPDNFTFGEHVRASKLYDAVENIQGIDSVEIITFKRLREPTVFEPSKKKDTATLNNLEKGYIFMGEIEIAQLNNDRNYPEKGMLKLELEGGKR